MSTMTENGGQGPGAERGLDADSSATPAVRGARRGREGWVGDSSGDKLASFLGWFSVGLGVAQLVAPGGVARLIGTTGGKRSRRVMRAAGARELGQGVAILSTPRPREWVGTRIAGDVMDLALLGSVFAAGSERKNRTALATLAVAGVTALDVLSYERLAQARRSPSPKAANGSGTRVQRSITIRRPVEEVYGFWRNFENLPRFMRHLESVRMTGERTSHWSAKGPAGKSVEWTAVLTDDVPNELIAWETEGSSDIYHNGRVSFAPAAAGAATVVTVVMNYEAPGGELGTAFLKLLRKEPGQQVHDDLRHFKQVLEIGEVVLSDATAASGSHAAQPLTREEWEERLGTAQARSPLHAGEGAGSAEVIR